jgi:hypothetical protein
MYDIVFISYNELQSTSRYIELITAFPYHRILRVNGVKGIHQAHIEAAKRANTKMFYVIDADAKILPSFKFDIKLDPSEENIVHVWRSINPVNGLEYGYGGVKLLPTDLTLNLDRDTIDMTTKISPRFKVMPDISNITQFNVDPLATWRSAFRECVKLSCSEDAESKHRLNIWLTVGESEQFGEYAKGGASAGQWYGTTYKDDPEALRKINDYDWLEHQFNAHIEQFPPETFK